VLSFVVVTENQCALSNKHFILAVSDSYILITLTLCIISKCVTLLVPIIRNCCVDWFYFRPNQPK